MIHFLMTYPAYQFVQSMRSIFATPDQGQLDSENKQEAILRPHLQDLINTCGLKNILILAPRMSSDVPGTCQGSALFKNTWKMIAVNGEYHCADPAAMRLVAKHEMGHILNNDFLIFPVIELIYSACLCVLLSKTKLPMVQKFIAGVICYLAVKVLILRYIEAGADAFAHKHATRDELKGGIRLESAHIKHGLQERERWYGKFFIASSGEGFLTCLHHPSSHSRLKERCKLLQERFNEVYEPTDEDLAPLLSCLSLPRGNLFK